MTRKVVMAFGYFVLVFILFWQSLFLFDFTNTDPPMRFGVTFFPGQTDYLGLDGREVYRAMLDQLGVRNLRLGAYWNRIEKTQGYYDFSELDYYMNEAAKRQAKVILVVGRRLPRWPECHDPDWVKGLAEEEKFERNLNLVTKTVERYRNHPSLEFWQVENEPFLHLFGICPIMKKPHFIKEINLVKELDPRHSIFSTDAGEVATWLRTAPHTEYFGSTFYRVVWSPLVGYINHDPSMPPAQYRLKAWLVRKPVDKLFLIEIQAEPWPPGTDLVSTEFNEQFKSFSFEQFKLNIKNARATGFPRGYLWGVEWWYWLRSQGHSEFWDYAGTIFE